jgi:murein DD-endopeptidase MepM/ murein hydrolase activator NlpD
MNRLGWLILTIFFAVGVFVFWSTEHPPKAESAGQTSENAVVDQPGSLRIPVAEITADRLVDTWQQARDNGARAHQAIDIPAPMGTPVVAAMAGRVEKLFQSNAGGTTVYVRSTDRRWLTYYAHLSGYTAGLAEGQAVAVGQQIGFVGDTGNAGAGNTHLHFALQRMTAGEKWHEGTPVDPYPYLVGKPVAR